MEPPLQLDNKRWTQQYVSPAKDFVTRKAVKDEAAGRMAIGEAHENSAGYPNYKLVGFEPAQPGFQWAYYCKTRDAQESYNWAHAELLANEWPEVRQTWVLPRATFLSEGGIAKAAPPALGGHVWTFMGASQSRLPDYMDGLFVGVEHVYWDIRQPRTSEIVDADTGDLRLVERSVVPASTHGFSGNAAGMMGEIQPINGLHSYLTSRPINGLAGRAVNGRAFRTVRGVDLASWEAVLEYIAIIAENEDEQNIYSDVVSYNVVPVYLVEAYNGPCKVTMLERWTKKKPDFGGITDWSTESPEESYPDIPAPTVMLARGIVFNGRRLRVQVPPCLRGAYTFWDGGYSQFYQASEPERWPSTRVEYVKVMEEAGGWLTRWLMVDAPTIKGQTTGIDIKLSTEPTATTAQIEWTPQAEDGAVQVTYLDVSTDPAFDGDYLAGFRNKVVTPAGNTPPLRTTITGLARGQLYYARIRRGALTSNTLSVLAKPLPEITVTRSGLTLPSETTLSFGAVPVGEQGVITIKVQSIGLRTVQDLAATLNGAEEFGFSELPTRLASGASADWEIRFDPVAVGAFTATLELHSTAVGSPYRLLLSGAGAAAEIALEQPAGTDLPTGNTLSFGSVTTGSTSKVFKLRNVGNALLQNLSAVITGESQGDYTFTSILDGAEIAAGGFKNFTVRFDPADSPDAYATRTAQLRITSSDADENPFLLNLTGAYQNPFTAGAVDWPFNLPVNGTLRCMAWQADGKLLIGGEFGTVNGSARTYLARLNADGTLDSFAPTVDGNVLAIAVQTDGKILIGGAFTGGIKRLNEDGSTDSGFTPSVTGEVRCLAIQSDEKILAGGNITGYLLRLNADGTADSGFTHEINGAVNGVTLDANGKIVVVGEWYDGGSPPPSSTPPSSTPPSSTPPSSTPTSSTPPSSTPPSSTPPSSTPPSSTPPSSTPPSSTPPSSTPPSSTPPSSTPPSSTPPSSTPPSSTPPSSTPPSSTPPSSTPPSSTPPSSTPPSSTP